MNFKHTLLNVALAATGLALVAIGTSAVASGEDTPPVQQTEQEPVVARAAAPATSSRPTMNPVDERTQAQLRVKVPATKMARDLFGATAAGFTPRLVAPSYGDGTKVTGYAVEFVSNTPATLPASSAKLPGAPVDFIGVTDAWVFVDLAYVPQSVTFGNGRPDPSAPAQPTVDPGALND